MLDVNNKLYVFHDDDSSFVDFSSKALDYSRDTFSVALVSNDDRFYVGFTKPINAFYVELSTANTSDNTFTAEFYNGSSWTALVGFFDDTLGWNRSGFMRWNRNQTSEAATEVNSQSAFWYRFTPSADHDAETVLKGLNIVYSDDQDLKKELYEYADFLPSGESSHILTHVAARDEIIQSLRSDGRYKQDLSTGDLKNITAFDLLDISQVKVASTYLVLAKIFMAASDNIDDIYMEKSKMFRSLYNGAMKTMYISLDGDNDGILDDEERLDDNAPKLVRR